MNSMEAFRANLLAEYMTNAVKMADKVFKKIKYLEFEGLFKVKGEYRAICKKGIAFDQILSCELSNGAKKWLVKEIDQINWKIARFTLNKLNELYGLSLQLNEEWDLATTSDHEKIFLSFQLSVEVESEEWQSLSESIQNEIRIVFDAIDNAKYFLHSIDSYFVIDDEGVPVDVEYKNHLMARL